MDHVIDKLYRWLDIYKESEPNNKRAHDCIKNAIRELQHYYDTNTTDRCVSCGVPIGNTNLAVNTKIGMICKECCID